MLPNVVIFQGVGDGGLWETNGTASGTFELTPITGAKVSGLSPSNLTVFNGEVLFEGKDASGHFGLWATNGTAAGTLELTGTSGLNPNGLTVFNGQVLFNGTSGGVSGLWTTNGTTASELSGTSGLDPNRLTVFNGQVLFNGTSGGVSGLWTTNGTTASELTGVAGTSAGGLNPYDMTVFGGKVLFGGTDTSGRVGLWETNGTAGGTHELVAGANTLGLNPNDLTVLGSEALFSGFDASGHSGLWETNGTTTSELTGITDIHHNAILDFAPKFLTAYKGKILFNGRDATGDGLWVTDGTVGGTHEILPGSGAGGLDPTNFELFNGVVLFSGHDSNGHSQLWETDGTAPGTHEVTGIPGAPATGLAPFDLTSVALADILWQNASGQAAIWEMNGTNKIDGALVGANPGPSWKVVGTGDFNDDGHSDILWQNTSGQAAIWEMDGSNNRIAGGSQLVGPNPGPSWKVVGTGDFNDDGHSDILWQNTSGQAAIWEMDGTHQIAGGSQLVGPNPGPSWKVIGTGDFNDDGHSDILWQNTSGQAAIWEMDGTHQIAGGSQLVGPNPGPSWKVVGTGDFNGDGHSDILWQNTSGQAAIWEMDGTHQIAGGSQLVGSNPGPSWKAIGAGDFNGDGFSDILWQNASGQAAVWEMDGTNQIAGGSQLVGHNPGPSWKVIT